MLNSFKEVERVFVCEQNSLLAAPTIFPSIIPFPIPLISGSIVDLCSLTIPIRRHREQNSFFISAFINWQMISAASTLAEPPGTAQVAFELVRDGIVIFRAIDTLVRPPGVDTEVTVFGAFNLTHLNAASACDFSCINRFITFTLRANNILLNPPTTTTAAVGAVNLRIEELRC